MYIPLLPQLPRGPPQDPSSRQSSSPSTLAPPPGPGNIFTNLLNFLSQWTSPPDSETLLRRDTNNHFTALPLSDAQPRPPSPLTLSPPPSKWPLLFTFTNQHADHTKRDNAPLSHSPLISTNQDTLRATKRDMDSPQSRDITIGVIVGVVLLLFLAGLFFFLYRYHGSIRLTKKRKNRRYRYGSGSGGSGGSAGSSKGSSAGGMGERPPPPPGA